MIKVGKKGIEKFTGVYLYMYYPIVIKQLKYLIFNH